MVICGNSVRQQTTIRVQLVVTSASQVDDTGVLFRRVVKRKQEASLPTRTASATQSWVGAVVPTGNPHKVETACLNVFASTWILVNNLAVNSDAGTTHNKTILAIRTWLTVNSNTGHGTNVGNRIPGSLLGSHHYSHTKLIRRSEIRSECSQGCA